MPRVLVVYATRTGQTQRIAELIAEGIRFSGTEAPVVNASLPPSVAAYRWPKTMVGR